MKIPLHPKLRGEWAEVHFLARAAEHGLSVSKPYGDCRPYDFIVESHGRMFSVQVKSTSYKAPGCLGYRCQVRPLRRPRHRAAPVDFLAAYIIPEDAWYIIPYSQLEKKLIILLHSGGRRDRFRPYLEAWHLLSSPHSARR